MRESINYISDNLKDNDVVVIGCSGGPDSMALLDLLINYRKKHNIFIVCAHVNHNVRKESVDEAVFVGDYCKKYNIMFESMTIEKYGDDNFENEARNIRYNFFDSLIEKYNANYLMTAHHGDDLVETILMRIVRGSTLAGYSGFSLKVVKDKYTLLRPLVYTTKADILEYNKAHKIPYMIDKTNFDDIHTRNRYRKNVLPFLKKEDKNVHLKFIKYSKTLLSYVKYIDSLVSDIFSDVVKDNKVDIVKFKENDDLIQDRIIYKLLEEFYQDDLFLITDVHVSLIKKIIYSKKANTFVYLPNNVKAIKSYNEFCVIRETELLDSYEIELNDVVCLPNGKNIKVVDEADKNTNYYCRLNISDVTFPLMVRTRKSGDKMCVKGLKGTKKVKDIFIDSKISVRERRLWPVVTDSKGEIIWVPGLKKSKFDIPKSKKCDIILKYY